MIVYLATLAALTAAAAPLARRRLRYERRRLAVLAAFQRAATTLRTLHPALVAFGVSAVQAAAEFQRLAAVMSAQLGSPGARTAPPRGDA